MIAEVIELALNSDLFDSVIVSTDSEAIAEISIEHGANVPFLRPQSISEDHSTTKDVITHAIGKLHLAPQTQICCIYPSAILTQTEILKSGWELSKSLREKFVFPVCESPSSAYRALRLHSTNQSLTPIFPKYSEVRTQDLERTFYDAGQFYWARTEIWLSGGSIHESGAGLTVPWWQAIDLDEPEDLQRLKFAYQLYGKNK